MEEALSIQNDQNDQNISKIIFTHIYSHFVQYCTKFKGMSRLGLGKSTINQDFDNLGKMHFE